MGAFPKKLANPGSLGLLSPSIVSWHSLSVIQLLRFLVAETEGLVLECEKKAKNRC